jgi:hypothetical protein
MAANNIVVSDLVANLALARFENINSLVMTANKDYEGMFSGKEYMPGDTINIRDRNRDVVTVGPIANFEGVQEKTYPLTIEPQAVVSKAFSMRELSLEVDPKLERFNERYIVPAIDELAKYINEQIALKALTEINYTVGTPGTPINGFPSVRALRSKMLKQAMPVTSNSFLALSIDSAGSLQNGLNNQFNESLNTEILKEASLGRLARFEIYEDQSMIYHTTGTYATAGTITVNGPVASGSNVINFTGATPGATGIFRPGDTITLSGINSVNPIGRADNGDLMQFTVQNVANADGGGLGSITVFPEIISDVSDVRRNVSASIVGGETISLLGVTVPGTPATYVVNLGYCQKGLTVAMPRMEPIYNTMSSVKQDDKTGLSIRVSMDGDLKNAQNAIRFDVLWGARWFHEYAAKLVA